MGSGRWENTGRDFYTTTSKKAKTARSYREVFTSRDINKDLNPNGVALRESCDGEDNPESNAIIVALDVTGSMGSIAHEIAKDGLGTLIEGILERKPVTDPHIMFQAVGDVYCDSAPLQVSQFEADERIIQQLHDIFVEGGGGGNTTESYDLPWYFAGTRTAIDCFTKRKKKGYLFTIGDEMTPAGLKAGEIKAIFGTNEQKDYSASELLALAQEKYHVFHLIIEEGHFCSSDHSRKRVINDWKQLMGARAIPLSNYRHLSQTILACIELSEQGDDADVESVINSYQEKAVRETLRHALDAEL
jgi:hypothetical protein